VVDLATEGRGHGGASHPGAGTVEAIRQTARLAGDTGWNFIVGRSRQLFVDDAGWAWTLGRAAGVAAAILLLAAFVGCAVSVVRGARLRRTWPPVELELGAARRALLIAWLAGIWLSYATTQSSRIPPHYLIVTFPVSFAVIGVALADALAYTRGRAFRVATIATAAGVTAIAVAFVAFTLAFHHFIGQNGGANGDYGAVYRDKVALASEIRARGFDADDSVIEFLATGSLDPEHGPRPTVGVRDAFEASIPTPLACKQKPRRFGPLTACFPSG
jgi:hypothetical protein